MADIAVEQAPKKTSERGAVLETAWIMKFYILDLLPHNSLVKYLVDQGHMVTPPPMGDPEHGYSARRAAPGIYVLQT